MPYDAIKTDYASFSTVPQPANSLFKEGLPAGVLYQLGNWKAQKTFLAPIMDDKALYQLGNWKAQKTGCPSTST